VMKPDKSVNSAINAWELAAARYKDKCEAGHNPALEMLDDNIGPFLADLRDKAVLDAGCGYGRLIPRILESGAKATGVDASKAMIRLARDAVKAYDSGQCRLLVANLSDLDQLRSKSFDLILAINVLQDLPDLELSLWEFARVARSGARLVIAIENPANRGPEVNAEPTYSERKFVSRFLGEGFPIEGWHRPTSTYIEGLRNAGFERIRLVEPLPSGGLLARFPALKRWKSRPLFLIIEATRSLDSAADSDPEKPH
jgi:SAM-dependent methyltransferase